MATPSAPFVVAPPVRETWRPNLVNAARQTRNYYGPDTEASARGVTFRPQYPAAGDQTRTFDPCDSSGPDPTYAAADGIADTLWFVPWGVSFVHECPAIGGDPQMAVAQARQSMGELTSHLLEETLWTGVLDVGTSLETVAAATSQTHNGKTVNPDNRRLASSSATLIDGTDGHDLVQALGLITEWLADSSGSGPATPYKAWIHAEARVAPFFDFYGQSLRTQNGMSNEMRSGEHRFVFGTGYTGYSAELAVAAATETWLIVTNPLLVGESEIAPSADVPASAVVSRSDNRIKVVATRQVVAGWDLTIHGAIKVCLPAPGPACS